MPNAPQCQGKRCKDHINCERCGMIRQYKFAESAERGIPENAQITYAVIRPENPQDLIPMKRLITRWSTRKAKGHCWTIETGRTCHGLHLNIILVGDNEITEAEITKAVGISADIWASKIKRSDFKTIARYIAKHKSIPAKDEYNGRTMGRSGCMLKITDYLARASGGVANLATIDLRMKKAGMPKIDYPSNHHALKHTPTAERAISIPHDYEPYAVDNHGNIINNPNYIPPELEYPDIRERWQTKKQS